MYYFPQDCSRYKYYYSEPNELHCVQNGVETGRIISPASQEQISNYRAQEAQENARYRESLDRLNRSMKAATPKITHTNCNSAYRNINCTSTTY